MGRKKKSKSGGEFAEYCTAANSSSGRSHSGRTRKCSVSPDVFLMSCEHLVGCLMEVTADLLRVSRCHGCNEGVIDDRVNGGAQLCFAN